ncbi:MAG: Ldh family oxidoreductase [Desulfobaccales bacterium]
MERFNPERIKELLVKIFAATGVPAAEALILSESLVEADLQGTSTHGVSRVGIYSRRLRQGLIDPRADLTIEKKWPAVLTVNANNGLGQVQAYKTLQLLIPMARESGCASATIHNSNHCGALSYFTNKAAENDMILWAMTNVESSMPPTGGRSAFFGTNPLAISFPTGKGYPIKIDLSTSVVARGNIITAQRKGEAIPLGWALDAQGNPTSDADKAMAGTVLTMAGHKGYALALMIEVLSGVLSGSDIGPAVGSLYRDFSRTQNIGHFFSLFNIAAFMDIDLFKERLDGMVDRIKGGEKLPGVEEILVPGERSLKTSRANRRLGIPIGAETISEIKALCREFGIPVSLEDLQKI